MDNDAEKKYETISDVADESTGNRHIEFEIKPNIYQCFIKTDEWKETNEGFICKLRVRGIKESSLAKIHILDDIMMDHAPARNIANKVLLQIFDHEKMSFNTGNGKIICTWKDKVKPECDIYFKIEEFPFDRDVEDLIPPPNLDIGMKRKA